MKYIGKHLLITVAAAVMLFTAGMKELRGMEYIKTGPGMFSSLQMVTDSPSQNLNLTAFITSQVLQVSQPGIIDELWVRYQNADTVVKVLLVILVYLILSVIVLFVVILIHRQRKTTQMKRHKELKDEYQEQLAGFLFDDQVEKVQFRGINNKTNRQILIDEIMDLHNNLHGEVGEKLRELYFSVGLHKDSLRNVRSGRWDKKAKGFGELAQMGVKDANDVIRKEINSSNQILRIEAQVALVKLSDSDPLGFLDDLEHELSYWEQVKLYDTLIFHGIEIDSFERWLVNKNQSVVIFALSMIALFKHVHSGDKVRELLFSENSEVALAAVKAMKALEMGEYVEDLKILFRSESLKLESIIKSQRKNNNSLEIRSLDDLNPRKIRYEIVSAMMAVATEKEIPFLEQVILNPDGSYKIRLLAITVMLSIKPAGAARLNQLLDSSDDLVKKMIINVKQNQES